MQAYILAGGKSSRIGEDKGLKLLCEKPMVQYIIEALEKNNFTISIVANNIPYSTFGKHIISDLIKDKGPIGGIYTALNDTQYEDVFIVSCDMPFVDSEIIKKIKELYKKGAINVVKYGSIIQPLIGVYPKKIIPILNYQIKNNLLRIMDLLRICETSYINLSEHKSYINNNHIFTNVNTPFDFEKAIKIMQL